MKLSKALKLKNKLAGDVAQGQKLITEANVAEGGNARPHDVRQLYKELEENQRRLVHVKAAIASANEGIWARIFEMAELKARIAFLRALPTKHGKHLVEGRYGSESVEREYHSELSAAWVEAEVKGLQARIERMQDEVDEHNAVKEVNV